ncbi:hypothetical protein H5410_021754, partial [Solanum commersonii]
LDTSQGKRRLEIGLMLRPDIKNDEFYFVGSTKRQNFYRRRRILTILLANKKIWSTLYGSVSISFSNISFRPLIKF